ncbi:MULTISPECIES: TetR/AcrR family transcriptional regulator [Nocardia]|uniref:TetR/AcrR family transcriptional regulator n=1 Tax=Nocardia TaxID=1817 RepID=UPI000AA7D008|nr:MULTISPECIES: TetR/AcrR family transcriptional regulator [Nocardia]
MTNPGKPVPTRAEKQRETRERLVTAAVELFFVQGFEATTVEAIAARAGFTHGAVFSNFSGKDELGAAVLDHVYGGVIKRLGLVRVDTADQLISVVSTWAFLAATRTSWIELEFSPKPPIPAPARAIPLTQLVTALGDWLADAAERIGAPPTDCEVTVSLVVCVLLGLVTQHPEPADITVEMVRSYIELALTDIVGPRRHAPPPPTPQRSPC